jgi:hypothetical protein
MPSRNRWKHLWNRCKQCVVILLPNITIIIALYDQAKDDVEDRNAPEQVHLAIALMEASRAELSLATLDTAVNLLRHVIDERQITPGHPLYISSMSNLASALGFRFIYANQLEDFVAAFSLRRKIIEACNEGQATSSVSVCSLELTSND